MPPHMGLPTLATQVAVWYASNLLFNLGMKRSHALVPDVVVLTTIQFTLGGVALAGMTSLGIVQLPAGQWLRLIACSAVLFLGGTLSTNVSLILLSVSFTHVIKTCEPLFTVLIVCAWDRKLPNLTVMLSLGVTICGVLIATMTQRKRSASESFVGLGVSVGMLANACLQLRNVLNKKLMQSTSSLLSVTPPAKNSLASHQGSPSPVVASAPRPLDLILVTIGAALPMQFALHSLGDIVLALDPAPPTTSRYAHYADANVAWLVATPLLFISYQIASILVLSQIDPVMHAVLNSLKRMVVIGLGTLLMAEPLSAGFAFGAIVSLVGVGTYSLAKALPSREANGRMQLCLLAVLVLVLGCVFSPGGGIGGIAIFKPMPPPPSAAVREGVRATTVATTVATACEHHAAVPRQLSDSPYLQPYLPKPVFSGTRGDDPALTVGERVTEYTRAHASGRLRLRTRTEWEAQLAESVSTALLRGAKPHNASDPKAAEWLSNLFKYDEQRYKKWAPHVSLAESLQPITTAEAMVRCWQHDVEKGLALGGEMRLHFGVDSGVMRRLNATAKLVASRKPSLGRPEDSLALSAVISGLRAYVAKHKAHGAEPRAEVSQMLAYWEKSLSKQARRLAGDAAPALSNPAGGIRTLTRDQVPTYSLAHSLTYVLTHSRTHARTHALTHALTLAPTHSRTHSRTHSLTRLLAFGIRAHERPGSGLVGVRQAERQADEPRRPLAILLVAPLAAPV